MRTQAPKRYRDADIAAMQRYRFNPYKEALLNPISGPLVGVPSVVPVDTFRCRIKVNGTIQTTGGAITILANPVAALCSDPINIGTGLVGPINYLNGTSISTVADAVVTGAFYSNAQYTRSQFAGLTNTSSVRGRVVSACLRVCNVSSTNTRNGVLTLYKDPAHNTLQGKTSVNVANDPRARQYNASTTAWHNVLYHPVEPEEADGWVWDPSIGPQAGTKITAANPPAAGDATPTDTVPGYMGIWWRGDTGVSQTLQVEMYIIAEYVGTLVQPLVTENEATVDDMQEAHHTAENNTVFFTPAEKGSDHTGHPESSTVRRVIDFGKEHSKGLITAGKIGLVGVAGKMGGVDAARGAAELLFSPGTIQRANQYNDYYNSYANRGRTPAQSYISTPSRARLTEY